MQDPYMPTIRSRDPLVFAIAFALTVKETAKHHPKGVSAAYADIGATLAEYSFRWVQGN